MMVLLIKKQQSGVLGKREWWQIGSNTAIVAYGKDRCGVTILDHKRHDITVEIAQKLQSLGGQSVSIIQTMDAYLLESSPDNLLDLLQEIERISEKP